MPPRLRRTEREELCWRYRRRARTSFPTPRTRPEDIETRGDVHVPREPGDFILRVIQHPDKVDDDGDGFHDDKVARPNAADYGDSDFQSGE